MRFFFSSLFPAFFYHCFPINDRLARLTSASFGQGELNTMKWLQDACRVYQTRNTLQRLHASVKCPLKAIPSLTLTKRHFNARWVYACYTAVDHLYRSHPWYSTAPQPRPVVFRLVIEII
ncbi:uncharacterized protein BDW43DRAFT_104598 [Aspergillus alliaceus]|uniref:uncharacterized protein n=1 Tax=Petromyces alliaceus TaxID=209559 RepID=UPI0012A561DB|nr:uncharacterized protein BDW43DRAFT_104598 [Aspergillus alliaceus]KAB8232817.1 hypothetical protein BDW43DRAFT_104598 [Aspergillus alliaceus]